MGPLRFHPPQPAEPWHEPRDAGSFGYAAMQPADPRLDLRVPISEDCLTLNIWAPAEGGPYPVLFWVHGGANLTGSTSQRLYDGASFAADGLVFVSANYRLGAFGFIELGGLLPELAGSGVNGLRDLLAAIHWVHDNIAAFGGDPGAVTLMGESAGGKNIAALATSPAAHGLFHRLAIQSGDLASVYPSIEAATPATLALLEAAGLDGDARQLARLPAELITAAQAALRESWPKAIRPTAGNDLLPLAPIDAARAGATRHLAMIIGTCRDESVLFLPPDIAEQALDGRLFAHIDAGAMADMERRYATALSELTLSERHIRQLSAEEFWAPAIRFAEAHADAGGAAWMYRFDIVNEAGPFRGYAPHAADLLFTFDAPPESLKLGFDFGAASPALHALWSGWAKTGIAAFAAAPEWRRYQRGDRETLLIDRLPRVTRDPQAAERRLWAGVI